MLTVAFPDAPHAIVQYFVQPKPQEGVFPSEGRTNMTRSLLLGSAVVLLSCMMAAAQDDSPAPPQPTSNGGAGIRAGNIAPTGKTMPNPGGSRGAGTTSMDRGIQAEDNKITGSICKGC